MKSHKQEAAKLNLRISKVLDSISDKIPQKDYKGDVVFPNGRKQMETIIKSLYTVCGLKKDRDLTKELALDFLNAYFYTHIFYYYDVDAKELVHRIIQKSGNIVSTNVNDVIAFCLCNLKNNYFQYHTYNATAVTVEKYYFKKEVRGEKKYKEQLKDIEFTDRVTLLEPAYPDGSKVMPLPLQQDTPEVFLARLCANDMSDLDWKYIQRIETDDDFEDPYIEEYHGFLKNGERYTDIFLIPNSAHTIRYNLRDVRYKKIPSYALYVIENIVNRNRFLQGKDKIITTYRRSLNGKIYEFETAVKKIESQIEKNIEFGQFWLYTTTDGRTIRSDRYMSSAYKNRYSVTEDIINFGFDNHLFNSEKQFNRHETRVIVLNDIRKYFTGKVQLKLVKRFSHNSFENYVNLLMYCCFVGIAIADYHNHNYEGKAIINMMVNCGNKSDNSIIEYIRGKSAQYSGGDRFNIERQVRQLLYPGVCMFNKCSAEMKLGAEYPELFAVSDQFIELMYAMAMIGMYLELHELYFRTSPVLENDVSSTLLEFNDIFDFETACSLSRAQIANIIICLPEAKRNLDEESFNRVYTFFLRISQDKTPIALNRTQLLKEAVNIIEQFEQCAPYFLYDGGVSEKITPEMKDIIIRWYNKGVGFDHVTEESEALEDLLYKQSLEEPFYSDLYSYILKINDGNVPPRKNFPLIRTKENIGPIIPEKGPISAPKVTYVKEVDKKESDTLLNKLELLEKLKELYDSGVLTQEEFDQKKKEILDSLT